MVGECIWNTGDSLRHLLGGGANALQLGSIENVQQPNVGMATMTQTIQESRLGSPHQLKNRDQRGYLRKLREYKMGRGRR